MDLGLFQRELAEMLEVDEGTIHNWECSYHAPSSGQVPKILEFLGPDSIDSDMVANYPVELKTFGDHIRKKRSEEGLTQRQLADQLQVSRDAISDWELGRSYPFAINKRKIIRYLGYDSFEQYDVNFKKS
ncbi:helix-turn-helix domain-containing protein [bacterium]|nr:helix-turn-helix domain-containing protein [candidate division CSSED10-310 bacterium]